ncbi:MAG: FIST C-terminal domain-containing protein [Oscillospiraceae bacterium]|nr:FIST C-terminal domain-containing protein [Oscillospiraceae bacterium]
MLKCASVYTYEIDDPEIALNEIKTQLDEKISLLEHTVGIIMCHTEFIGTGVLKHICDSLPFDLAGVTTSSQAVNDEIGEMILTIFIITSDDVWFIAGIADDVSGDVDGPVKTAYGKFAADEKPKMAIVFPPFGIHAGDEYLRAWRNIIPDTPVFGTCAIDDTADFSECDTIYNGINNKFAMPFVLCYGNINPRFMVATLSDNAVSSKGDITKAAGNCVFEINNDVALKYFEDGGYTQIAKFSPFKIDFLKREDYDGIPVIRGHAAFTDEGAAIFYGDVDEGSTLTILACNPDDILITTKQALKQINELLDVKGTILFPCVVRRATLLGAQKPLAELQCIKNTMNSDIPFMAGYSGGEICPTSVKNGMPTNRFHNYSLVICIL